jgi:arylamine N-acetyltransferase
MKNDSLENLNTILAGIRKIPYENITKIFRLTLSSKKRPRDFSLLLKENRELFRGGTCFSLSNTIIQLLRNNNISANAVIGKMERETFPHFFVIVDINNEKYIVDPGFMIHEPIRLTKNKQMEFSTSITKYLLKYNNEKYYELYSIKNNKKKFRYKFSLSPITDDEFKKYWIRSFDYINKIVASQIVDGKHIFISSDYVQIRQRNSIEKYKNRKTAHKYLMKYFHFTIKEILNAENILKSYCN